MMSENHLQIDQKKNKYMKSDRPEFKTTCHCKDGWHEANRDKQTTYSDESDIEGRWVESK